MWHILSKYSDNRAPYFLVNDKGVKYPKNILDSLNVAYFDYKSDATRKKEEIEKLDNDKQPVNFFMEEVETYDKVFIEKTLLSMYRNNLKFKIKDILKIKQDDYTIVERLNEIYKNLDSIDKVDDFEEICNEILDFY